MASRDIVRRIFDEALGQPTAGRAAYLEAACAGDAALRGEVESLLAAHEMAREFLGEPTVDSPGGGERAGGGSESADLAQVGTRIGRYKLLERIGEGGFGVVYMAEQEEPVRRRVALKIIKLGMDTRQVVARFEAERQALAMMDHANIAKVLDGGSTDMGRPYFVMELVKGVPITGYCDTRKLNTLERLGLFMCVCSAVQHAHQKGIIHRDLKPSNVLVAVHDDKPVVKIIDFGVAKAMQSRLTDKTLFTGFRQMVGTLAYMSPEQAQMSSLDVDTRSDIYSLGVLLYELLTGTTPFDSKALMSAAYEEMQRIIREVDPPPPSTRLSTLSPEALLMVAAQRHKDPRHLTLSLRGDLDWIVMRCLEKDRQRRYGTASALAEDLQRHLSDEPVEARRPTMGYRSRKFAVRHKVGIATAAVFVTILLLGVVVSTWQAVRAWRAERLAETQRDTTEQARRAAVVSALRAQEAADSERKAKEAETAQRQQAEEVSNYLTSALSSPSPWRDGRTITIAEVLDRDARELQGKFNDNPGTKAALLEVIGQSYMGLGLYREAIPLFEQALQLKKTMLGGEHADTLTAMHNLAFAYHMAGRFGESATLNEETLKLRRAKLGPEHPDALRSMQSLALDYWSLGGPSDALPLFEETYKIRKAKFGADDPETLASADTLGALYSSNGRSAEGVPLLQETLKLSQAKWGPEEMATFWMMDHLASAYRSAGRPAEAVTLDEKLLALRQSKLGADHPDALQSMRMLALDYRATGRLPESIALMEETLKFSKVKLGLDHPNTLWLMNDLADAYQKAGRLNDAVPLLEDAVKVGKAKLGPDHRNTLEAASALAWAYYKTKRMDEAIALQEEMLTGRKTTLGPEHADTLMSMHVLAFFYDYSKHFDQAIRLEEDTLKMRGAVLGAEHLDTIHSMHNLVRHLQRAGRLQEAAALAEETLKLEIARLGPDHADTRSTTRTLADIRTAQLRERQAKQVASCMAVVRGMAAQGKWDQAAAECVPVLESLSHDTDWNAPRKAMCREIAGWDQLFNRVVKLRPEDEDLWIGRGRHFVVHRDWKQALAQYERVRSALPVNAERLEYACLLLLLNDHAGYEQLLKETEAEEASPRAPISVIASQGIVPVEQMLQWSQKDVSVLAPRAHLVALAYYRDGKFKEAIESAKKVNNASWPKGAWSSNWLVMAMANQRLGDAAEARRCLEEAHKLLAPVSTPDTFDPEFLSAADLLCAAVLLREAELVFKQPPGPTTTTRP